MIFDDDDVEKDPNEKAVHIQVRWWPGCKNAREWQLNSQFLNPAFTSQVLAMLMWKVRIGEILRMNLRKAM